MWLYDEKGDIYPLVFPRRGLCTNFLARKQIGDQIEGSLVSIADISVDNGFKLKYWLCPLCPKRQKCQSFNDYILPFRKVRKS